MRPSGLKATFQTGPVWPRRSPEMPPPPGRAPPQPDRLVLVRGRERGARSGLNATLQTQLSYPERTAERLSNGIHVPQARRWIAGLADARLLPVWAERDLVDPVRVTGEQRLAELLVRAPGSRAERSCLRSRWRAVFPSGLNATLKPLVGVTPKRRAELAMRVRHSSPQSSTGCRRRSGWQACVPSGLKSAIRHTARVAVRRIDPSTHSRAPRAPRGR